MDRLVDHLFAFEGNGEIRDFPGNYSQYRRWKQLEENKPQKAKVVMPNAESKLPNQEDGKKTEGEEIRKLSFKEKMELEKLENEIAGLEEEKKILEVKMNNASSDNSRMDFEKLQEAAERISDIIVLLDKKETRWLELSERAGV
jgi:ATP-binding cassette subfamily F protein uup